MKLIAGFAALVAAAPAVTNCNAGNGGAAAMSMTIEKSDVQQAPTGWTLVGTQYQKTVDADTSNTAMGANNNLVMTHQISSGGCKKEKVDNIDVCTKIGHVITFTCLYSMDNQDIATDTDFQVSGSDTEKTATNTGSLEYKLTVDNTAFSIGSPVTATITPVTSGLVYATIESCSVTHTGKSESVKLIDDGMQRECALGVEVTNGQGNGNLGFTWSSFKWSTELVGGAASPTEDQEVSCNISLSKAQPTTETQSCVASSGGGDGDKAEAQITWTKFAGQYCDGDIGQHKRITLDECKTKCLSDPTKKCKFINYSSIGTCYLETAEQCADNKRGSDSGYDIYQPVESAQETWNGVADATCDGNEITMNVYSTIEVCKEKCLKDSTCEVVVYETTNGQCHFYTAGECLYDIASPGKTMYRHGGHGVQV